LALAPAARGADENGPWIPASLQFGFDAKLSAEVGADDGIALYYAEGRLEDRILKPSFWSEERFWPHLAGFGYRAVRSILLDDPLAAWLTVAQHEVFGHGYRGRLGIHELMLADEAVRMHVRHREAASVLQAAALAAGMKTLRQDGIDKVFAGLTDLSEVVSATTPT